MSDDPYSDDDRFWNGMGIAFVVFALIIMVVASVSGRPEIRCPEGSTLKQTQRDGRLCVVEPLKP